MSFTLTIDGPRWRDHLDHTNQAVREVTGYGLVGVVKGHGYGLGLATVIGEIDRLGADHVAVGTVFEALDVLQGCTVEVVVLEPYEPRDIAAQRIWHGLEEHGYLPRIVRTIASEQGLRALLTEQYHGRILLEARTSMSRFGFEGNNLARILVDPDLAKAVTDGGLEIAGLSLHLPMIDSDRESRLQEAIRWGEFWQAAQAASLNEVELGDTLWVSHLDVSELATISGLFPRMGIRARVGTRLWLGRRDTLSASGSVLAVHTLRKRTQVGYRQRTGPQGATLLVVAGGTHHGIGLSAPTPAATLRQRVVAVGTGALDAAGRALSPFSLHGERCWFAEPPHQHHSMLWMPRGGVPPDVGDQIPAEVRLTTTRFDAVLGLD